MNTFTSHLIAVSLPGKAALGTILPAAIKNPLDGVSPSLEVFGSKISLAISLVLGAVWMLALIAGIFIIFTGLAGAKNAQKRSHEPEKITAGMAQVKLGVVVLAIGFLLPALIGGLILFANRVNGA